MIFSKLWSWQRCHLCDLLDNFFPFILIYHYCWIGWTLLLFYMVIWRVKYIWHNLWFLYLPFLIDSMCIATNKDNWAYSLLSPILQKLYLFVRVMCNFFILSARLSYTLNILRETKKKRVTQSILFTFWWRVTGLQISYKYGQERMQKTSVAAGRKVNTYLHSKVHNTSLRDNFKRRKWQIWYKITLVT